MGFEILLTFLFVLLFVNFVILDYTVSKMKKDRLNLDVVAAIVAIETAVKKLNEKLRCETQSLSDYKQRLKRLEKRIDILEEGHPDTDIDYGTVDDDGNITEIWFNGKRYVPEDKSDEDTVTFYADNKVIAETTKQDVKCCATCRHYRPGPDHTCTIRPWLRVTKACANNTHSACNNYAKAYTPTKGQVDYPYITYEYMSGNCKTEQVAQRLDELQRELQKFNFAMSIGACTVNEFERRWEELTHNDS